MNSIKLHVGTDPAGKGDILENVLGSISVSYKSRVEVIRIVALPAVKADAVATFSRDADNRLAKLHGPDDSFKHPVVPVLQI